MQSQSLAPTSTARTSTPCRRASCTSCGTFTDAALDAWIATHEFSAFTARTVTDPKQFRADVLRARELGYWHTEQQLDAGLRGMSVALIDRKGRCRAALGMTVPMPAYRSGEHMVEAVLPLLLETAQQMRPVL